MSRRPTMMLLYFLLLSLTFLLLVDCDRGGNGDDDDDDDSPAPVIDAKMIFSGKWQGIAGTYLLDIKENDVTYLNNDLMLELQTSGYTDEYLFIDQGAQVLIGEFDGNATRTIVEARYALLAANGRKFFYNDPTSGLLYEAAVAGEGGVLFSDIARYGAHSPDLSRVAYLTADGLVVADADDTNQVWVEYPPFKDTEEYFALPEEGDFFPRWTPDGSLVAASITLEQYANNYRHNLLVIVEADGEPVTYIANGTQPRWSADGRRVYYNSNNQIYVWDLDEETNTLIAGGGDTLNYDHKLNDDGALIGFIRQNETGETSGHLVSLESNAPLKVVPDADGGMLTFDWVRESYCENGNSAPTLLAQGVINGEQTGTPIVTPGVEAQVQLSMQDADCNLAYGVALWTVEGQNWRPLSAHLPAASGCALPNVQLALPQLADGTYALQFAVEDVCGALSEPATLNVTYQGFGGDDDDDDDTTDDDTTDDDTTDDDTIDDDTTDDDTVD